MIMPPAGGGVPVTSRSRAQGRRQDEVLSTRNLKDIAVIFRCKKSTINVPCFKFCVYKAL